MAHANSPPLLLHPIIIFFYEQLIIALTAGFTSPRSPLRLLGLVVLSGWLWVALTTGQGHYHNRGWAPRVFAGSHASILVMYIDRILMKKWSFRTGLVDPDHHPKKGSHEASTEQITTQVEKETIAKPDGFGARLGYGFAVMDSARGAGTPWEVKNLPHFSTRDPSYVPSQSVFLLRNALAIVICYFGHNYFMSGPFWGSNDILLTSPYIPFLSRLGDVSTAEIVLRARVTLMYFTSQYCFLQFFYSLAAVANVSFKPQDLPLWRPLFGPFSEMYSVRQFWGVTWHQTLRRQLSAFANLFTYSILHLPRGILIARYTHIFFAFFGSGMMHLIADIGGKVRVRDSGCLSFFCAQALGIVLEDGVQEMYRRLRGSSTPGPLEKGAMRVLGYAWVVVFLSWSAPAWIYPWLQVARKEDNILSFGNFRSILPF
ncbi:MAG: hypothetical protein M1812_008212 [Candelaria pacifica]|nr:MAG: hypothetical protein M1812_008212 [Candelaria pacifica]